MMSVRLGTSRPSGTLGSGWFGPLQPMAPVAPPEVVGRQLDYPSGYNLVQYPRAYEGLSFWDIRALADSYDLLRLVIETRKDQFEKVRWTIRARTLPGQKRPETVDQSELSRVQAFLERPDRELDFHPWLRMVLEDLLVIDAPAIWKERSLGGELYALQPLDGATIKRVIDDRGRTPRPYIDPVSGATVVPPAYQQILKGLPAVDYTPDEIIYAPRNRRTSKIYGYSPVEQIIVTVNIALRRQVSTLSYFTAGNIPESLIGVPDGWTPDQIRAFQDNWDAYFEGSAGIARRRKAKFVPGGIAKTFIQTQDPELKGVFDEWLAKLVCFAFSISPQSLISQVNRATAQTQQEQAHDEGLAPLLEWVKRIMDRIVQIDLRCPGAEFAWDTDKRLSPKDEATVYSTYVDKGVMTRNEVREKIGMDPSTVPEAGELGFTTATGFVHLDETKKPEEPVDLLTGFAPIKGVGSLAEKTDEDKKNEKDDIQKMLLSMMQKNDWEHQPRDNQGRFGSTGGPSARERRKAERAERTRNSDVARDEMGRFTSGSMTAQGVAKIAKKVGNQLAIAAAVAGASHLAMKVVKDDELIPGIIESLVTDYVRDMSVRAAESVLTGALKFAGVDAEAADRTGRYFRKVVNKYLDKKDEIREEAEKKAESEAKRARSKEAAEEQARQAAQDRLDARRRAEEATAKEERAKRRARRKKKDDDAEKMLKSISDADDVTADEIHDLAVLGRSYLPSVLDTFVAHTVSELEDSGVSDNAIAAIEDALDEMRDDIVSAASSIGKMVKRAELETPSLDRRAARRAVFAARRTVLEALQKAWRANRATLAAGVATALEGLGKAVQPSEPGAARLAAALDLDAVSEIYIALGEDLGIVATDAARKILAKMSVSAEDAEEVYSRAAQWAEEHAAEITGQRVLEDGSIVKTTGGSYDITESTQKIVRDTISSGIRNGLSQEEIMSRLEDAGFSEDRAQNIAEYEVGTANSAGALEGYRAARDVGVPIVGKRWLTVGDEHVDNDICKMNEEQGTIPVDQEFQSGHMHPLGHPRCRCVLVPVFENDEDHESSEEEDD